MISYDREYLIMEIDMKFLMQIPNYILENLAQVPYDFLKRVTSIDSFLSSQTTERLGTQVLDSIQRA